MKLIGTLPSLLQRRPYLYRIELLDRFYQILETGRLTFVRPGLWSDPLENILFNAKLLRDGKPYLHPGSKAIYGQCWSTLSDSYALWQIYTTKTEGGKVLQTNGIRITTSLEKLRQFSERNGGEFFFGMMNYMSKKDIDLLRKDKEFIKGLFSEKIGEAHLRTLLVKRKSYSFESEIRLLAVPQADHVDPANDNLCRLNIQPKDFITSVLFDPRMGKEEFQSHKKRLVKEFGFRPTQVKQSTLAQHNPFRFEIGKV